MSINVQGDLVGVHEVANLGIQVRPCNVDLVAEHCAVRRDAGLVVTVETELREVGIGGGEGGVLAMLSRKGNSRSDKCCRNH